MKNILLVLSLLSYCEVARAQGCACMADKCSEEKLMDTIDKKIKHGYEEAQIRRLTQEALAITPYRVWVKSLDNSNWYYGYKEGNKFFYVKIYTAHGLSDLSNTYPISYRRGELKTVPRLNFVYESYQAQFDKATKGK